MIAPVTPFDDNTPAQTPMVNHREVMRLRDLITLHHLDSAQMRLVSTTNSERMFVEEEISNGRDDFLVAILPQNNRAELAEAVGILHRIRGKEPANVEKLDGLAEKGYMLIKEPEVADAMLKALPHCLAENKEKATGVCL